MKNIFINTIVKEKSKLNQLNFLKEIQALDLELEGIELRNEFDEIQHLSDKQIQDYKSLAEANDWTYFLSIPGDLFTDRGVRDDIESIFAAAQQLNISNIKFNLGNNQGIQHVDVDSFNALLQEYDLTVSIENGQSESNGTIEVINYALDKIADLGLKIGFTFDLGNWIVMRFNPLEAYDLFKDKIDFMHLKNTNLAGDWLLLNEGEADWTEYLQTEIPYILEYPMTSEELLRDYDNLERFL